MRKPTREELATKAARADAIESDMFAAQYILRTILDYDGFGTMYDLADHFAETETDGGSRFLAYGFNRRHTVTVLFVEIGTGAGESVINVETTDLDTFTNRYYRNDNPCTPLPLRILGERVTYGFKHGERTKV